jgi:acyl-CoA dehydrogenase family protein 9
MNAFAAHREEQIRQAEELLFSGPQEIGFAKGLFLGRFVADAILPYPQVPEAQRAEVEAAVAEVRRFVDERLDPAAIDRQADIPRSTIDELGRLGVLGMAAPREYGGRGFGQLGYCRVLEVIGSACASTSVFVNAHHSIGLRALVIFGTEEQKHTWLPAMVRGEKLGAFALTESEAGSDAANVQTRAVPSADGEYFTLNGDKRYITNGAIAQVLTVMARTPVAGSDKTKITAFLVTPDMPGFEVVEPRMEKLGIRGTATARLAFHDMRVPRANVLGAPGQGLKVALTVLDFGRTTFGATCTGAAKTCLRLAARHANRRRQFGQTLGEFELIKKKLARMAAWSYAMEAMTTVTSGLIDSAREDYMLETAMLKVYCTEALWAIVNDAFQIYGGRAYFTDEPLERMLRDARINQIGEGANEVLAGFIALVGLRTPAETLKTIYDARAMPLHALPLASRYLLSRAQHRWAAPAVPLRHPALHAEGHRLGRLIQRFDSELQGAMFRHREAILEREYVQERIAIAAVELFAMSAVLSRLDAELPRATRDLATAHPPAALLLRTAARRLDRALDALHHNDDDAVTAAANWALRQANGAPPHAAASR